MLQNTRDDREDPEFIEGLVWKWFKVEEVSLSADTIMFTVEINGRRKI